MHQLARRAALAALLLPALAPALRAQAAAPAVAAPVPAPFDSALAVATFDSAWSIINRRHFDPTFGGRDWNALRDTLRPRAAAARDREALRGVVREMIARLALSHYALLPAEVASSVGARRGPATGGRPGEVGLDVRLVGGALVVREVVPGSAADQAGIRRGWTLVGVDSTDVARLAANRPAALAERSFAFQVPQAVHGMLMGAPGSSVTVRLRDGRNREVARTLVRAAVPGVPVTFGHLPTMYANAARRDTTTKGARVGIVRFNVWMTVVTPAVDSAVDAFRDADGIVFDLRGNPGGVAGMVMGMAGHLIDTTSPLGIMKSREATLTFVTNPRRVNPAGQRVRPYTGAVAILVDELSASTTEFFAAGLQELGRARVFGARTSGQALPAQLTQLPNGDVLYHAVADFTTPKGARLEKGGVLPDVATPLTRESLLAGRDAALEAALGWISSQRAATKAR